MGAASPLRSQARWPRLMYVRMGPSAQSLNYLVDQTGNTDSHPDLSRWASHSRSAPRDCCLPSLSLRSRLSAEANLRTDYSRRLRASGRELSKARSEEHTSEL